MRHGHRDRRARVSDPAGLESHRVTRRLVTPVRPVFSVAGPRPGTLAHKWHSGSPESQSPGRLYVPTLARNHQSQDHVHHDPRKQPSRPIAGGCGHGPNKRAVTRSAAEQRTRRRKQNVRHFEICSGFGSWRNQWRDCEDGLRPPGKNQDHPASPVGKYKRCKGW